jgi:hypothetical protein
MRECRKCGKVQLVEEFQVAKIIGDKVYRRHVCTSCKISQQRAREQRNRAALRELKLCCIECGEDHPAVLSFHHRERSKKSFTISDSYHMSLDKLLKEADKCDILCLNCHAKKHWVKV